jgi:hypothetical protein
LFLNWQLYNNSDGCGEYSLRTWIKKLRRFVNTIAHFTNARSIHSGFYKWKTMDDNKKKLIAQMVIDTKFFHRAFVNPLYDVKPKAHSERRASCCAFGH